MEKPKLHVLLIDDDRIQLFAVKKIITSTGLADKMGVCANGKEGIEYLSGLIKTGAAVPDVIFLDINMPVMSGWEFLEAYKDFDLAGAKRSIIYIVTSSADAFDVIKAKTFNLVEGYLVKPVAKDKFIQLLTSLQGS